MSLEKEKTLLLVAHSLLQCHFGVFCKLTLAHEYKYACYDLSQRCIFINIEKVKKQYDLIELLCHEYCHAIQHYDKRIETCDGQFFYKNVAQPDPLLTLTDELYESLPWEVEANNFAKKMKPEVEYWLKDRVYE